MRLRPWWPYADMRRCAVRQRRIRARRCDRVLAHRAVASRARGGCCYLIGAIWAVILAIAGAAYIALPCAAAAGAWGGVVDQAEGSRPSFSQRLLQVVSAQHGARSTARVQLQESGSAIDGMLDGSFRSNTMKPYAVPVGVEVRGFRFQLFHMSWVT